MTFWLQIYIILVIQNFFFQIPVTGIVRYLGKRLHPQAWLKRTQVNTRYRMSLRLLDSRPHLTVSYKLLIYNTILKPTWTYRLELWGLTKPSNISRLQSPQSKILGKIAGTPLYVSNITLHNDLHVPLVKDLARSRYQTLKILVSYGSCDEKHPVVYCF